MVVKDFNQTLRVPAGDLTSVQAAGSFLRLEYSASLYRRGTLQVIGEVITVIYLEGNYGREVLRTSESRLFPPPPPRPVPVSRRFKIWNGFLLALEGLREMVR